MILIKFLVLASLFVQSAFASILPENNLAIPLSEKNDGLTEEQYNANIDKIESIYAPIVRRKGAKLMIQRLWDNPRVNAGTLIKENEWIIKLYGGYARHPLVTADGYALVICHELGHHLGESPKKVYNNGEISWPSVEGQADYFATLKCLRKIFNKDDNIAVISHLEVPMVARVKCTMAFKTAWEVAICIRTTMAGIAVSAISADVRRTALPSVELTDTNIVSETVEGHPLPQCRLDTYFHGSICKVSSYESLSLNDERTGTCHTSRGHIEGIRPACWFKATK